MGRHDLNGLYALMERWMDIAHTFHLLIGELTLDPEAFTAMMRPTSYLITRIRNNLLGSLLKDLSSINFDRN